MAQPLQIRQILHQIEVLESRNECFHFPIFQIALTSSAMEKRDLRPKLQLENDGKELQDVIIVITFCTSLCAELKLSSWWMARLRSVRVILQRLRKYALHCLQDLEKPPNLGLSSLQALPPKCAV